MSVPHADFKRQEVYELADAALSGTITAEQSERLSGLVCNDVEARRHYVRFMHASATLCEWGNDWIATQDVENEWNEDAGAQVSMKDLAVARFSIDAARPDPLPSTFPYSFTALSSSSVGAMVFSYLVAAVVVGVGMLIAACWKVSDYSQIAGLPTAPSRATHEPVATGVGRITGMVDCVSTESNAEIFNGANVPLNSRYVLQSGLMEITYNTGAKVILQGPVTYEVELKNGGFMSVGKLTGQVTSTLAKGFSVRTPTAIVTDLGTEFGVEVNESGETDAQVFVGKVNITAVGGHDANRLAQTVVAGQSVHVGTDLVLRTSRRDFESHVEHFARAMPDGANAGDSYAGLVLSMNPVVYYRMSQWPETDKNGCYVLVDSASGGHHGAAYLDKAFGGPKSRGKLGGALDIHGSTGGEYVFVNSYPKATNGQLSVSAWVRAVSLDPWATIVANWSAAPSGETVGGQFSFGVNHHFELATVIQQQDGNVVNICERGLPLPRSQWQHVAFVADGAILRLYRNGVEVGAAPCRGIARSPMPECLSVGCQMNLAGSKPRPDSALEWNGLLDEIAVFNHTLSVEQVRRLYTGHIAAGSREASP